MAGFGVVRVDGVTFGNLRKAAQTMGQSVAQLVRLSVEKALPSIVQTWRDSAVSRVSRQADELAAAIGPAKSMEGGTSQKKNRGERSMAMSTKDVARLRAPVMSRKREPRQGLVWVFNITFSKLPASFRGEWSLEKLRVFGKWVWRTCKKHNCISYGGGGGSVWNESSLLNETPSEARQMRFLPNMLAGDIVVATWGERVLGWGYVRAKLASAYAWRPHSLRGVRGKLSRTFRTSRFWWFNHVIWVDWQQFFGPNGVVAPKCMPLQPTVRWPVSRNLEAWRFLRELGLPVGIHGEVSCDKPGAQHPLTDNALKEEE